jgi:two-component system phosphate regulon sensor histidine kinase PhoR
MNNLTPRKLALVVALLLATTVSVTLSVLFILQNDFRIYYSFATFIATFIIAYFLFLFAIEKFVYNKIKVIYKTIHNLKIDPKNKLHNLNLETDILNDVNKQVIDWHSRNQEEIDRLKKLEIYRREFIGNLAHELKTPIFNIQGYILTLLEGGLNDSTINKDYLFRSEKSVERMIALVEDLDMISKLESGGLALNIEKTDLLALTKEIVKSIELQAKENNIKILLKDASEKPIWIIADKARITQVLTNLLVNSIKYGKENGQTQIAFYDLDENILVEIKDNGIGISNEHLPRIFERFYRADKSRSRTSGGTGLGLSIVKHIIEAHQQTISVKSELDVGSTFSFTLKKA